VSIQNDIKKQLSNAQKQKNEVAISTLRLALASIKNHQIELKKEEISDDEIVKVLKKEAKKRNESITAYKKGGRDEMADREQQELDIIKTFLPAEMGADEVRQIVGRVIEQQGGTAAVNFGQVMGEVMKQTGGKADGKLVSQIVKETLASA